MKPASLITRAASLLIIAWTLPAQTSNTAHAVTTTGGTVNVVPKYSGSSSIVNSNIFENGGKVGIGTTSPSSTLTVKGEIQSTNGGFKFPDNTVQSTAAKTGLLAVSHDASLSGGGTSSSPLGIANPLTLSSTSLPDASILNVNNNTDPLMSGVPGWAIYAVSNGGTAIEGHSSTAGCCYVDTGVAGFNDDNEGTGVSGAGGTGVAGSSSVDYGDGVFGTSSGNYSYAAWFEGDVNVTGTLSKAGGSFKIDDPRDPANKYLSHSFVESPDMMNVYNGNATTDQRGFAVVSMPDYFSALNRDFRYQLTVIGEFAQAIVASEMQNNQFTIRTDKPSVKVSWQVTGIRQDPWANAHRIKVEEDKPEKERDHYLHPELYNQPPDKSIEWARHPALEQRLSAKHNLQ